MNMMEESARSDPEPNEPARPHTTEIRVTQDAMDAPPGTGIEHLDAADLDNARRFVAQHGSRVRYDHTYDEWRYYDGTRWVKDELRRAVELMKQTAEATYSEALASGDKDFIRQARAFRNYNGLRNALACTASMPEIAVKASDWDRNIDLFNVKNGTIDLVTGTIRHHSSADMITMIAGCDFEEGRQAVFFPACLAAYWPNLAGEDDGIIEFLTTTMGYCLSGRNTEKMFMLLVGTGDTGKTTFMHAIEAVWGEYFRTVDWSTFAQQRENDGARHRTDLARLVGARIVSASEGEEGCRMSDGMIKRVTGRSKLIVRDLLSKPFELPSTYKIWLDTNHGPHFKGQDRAMRNRVRRVPFRNIISAEQQHSFRLRYGNLDERLEEDAPGVLNIALAGFRRFQETGRIVVPGTIQTATKEYMDGEDVLGEFIRDRCSEKAQAQTPRLELFRQYQEWARESGEFVMSARRFYAMLGEREGIRVVKYEGERRIVGLAVNKTMSEREQERGLFGGRTFG
ncbi:MAG TPA: phage/plasmid primase, P4 family [Candidatus Kapabacteria bacterium]|nr:phage/plasmid primase, P4 family [Candidatus Kapabacteria bacterium]